MFKVSACIITRNEEAHLEACVASLGFADEVVVVDSVSTDRTPEIARRLGCRLITQEFLGHVRQKQLAVDRAQHDWVFCIDADERVDERLRQGIEALKAGEEPRAAGFLVNRHTHYLGAFIDHGGWFPEWRLRLFDRRRGRWGGVDPHDHVHVDGETRRLDGELVHYNYRDLSHHLRKIDSYTTIIAARKQEAGRGFRLRDLLLRPPGRFLRMYLLRGGWRDGLRGFLVAAMGAFYVFLKYAKLWERERAEMAAAVEGRSASAAPAPASSSEPER